MTTKPQIGATIPADFVKKHTPASEQELDKLARITSAKRRRGQGFAK